MECNGDVSRKGDTWTFTPATNTEPTEKYKVIRWLAWKGKRVEVAERKHMTYKDGVSLNYDLKFTLLDDSILDDTEYVGIHQLWSGGHLYPKYFAYLKRKDKGVEFQVRQCSVISNDDADPIFTYSKAVKIELGKEYKLDVSFLIDNVKNDIPRGNITVAMNGKELINKTCFNSDSERLIEKFGCYCKAIITGNYRPMIKIKIKRKWLN